MLGRETVETLISRKNKEDETSHKSNRDDFWVFSPAKLLSKQAEEGETTHIDTHSVTNF